MKKKIIKHYNRNYYNWQKKAGEYGASQDLWMYSEFIKKTDKVLDFGCGGGFMLNNLECKHKYGVEINQFARSEAEKHKIKVFKKIKNIPKKLKFDVVFSHHVLEHLENPLLTIKELKEYLKRQGLIIVVVPIDDWRCQKKYKKNDINMHLYTWTPLLLGNLFNLAGYDIKKIEIISTAWLPLSRFYFNYIPKPVYYFLTKIWGRLIKSRQIRVIAALVSS